MKNSDTSQVKPVERSSGEKKIEEKMVQKDRNLIGAIEKLKRHGYLNSFRLNEGRLECAENQKTYSADQIEIHDALRAEGQSDPDDSRIVYALKSADGTKGVITDAFGVYASLELAEFLQSARDVRTGLSE